MSKELEALTKVNTLIDDIDNYEKQTGRKNPPAYIERETLVEFQQALLKLQKIDETITNCLKYSGNVMGSQFYQISYHTLIEIITILKGKEVNNE